MTSLSTRIVRILGSIFILIAAAGLADRAHAQATGDFNNDGVDDLAIGAPGESINAGLEAGAVHVLYGSGGGLSSVASQFWHLDRPGVPGAAETADHLGRALAAGDFNGDGYDDLAIGISGREVGGAPEAGAVLVLYGGANGLAAANAALWNQDIQGVKDTAQWNDRFGQSLTSGDYDGDGFDDLAVGIPGEDGEFGLDVGAVAIFYGSLAGITATGNQFLQQDAPGINGTAEGNDEFGETLASGDFNNDGRDDLVIGVPHESFDNQDEAGIVHVLFGTAGGIVTAASQTWSQNANGVPDAAEDDDRFGTAMTAGDFNDDGYDDLAIGVPGESVGTVADAGGVLILYGSASGPNTVGVKFWTQNANGLINESRTGNRFGQALGSGDFNGDDFDDLAVGAPGQNVSAVAQAGVVQILLGTANGIRAAGNQFWSQDSNGVLDRCEVNDRFGATLGAGDFDDDGFDDLGIGVPFENVGASDAGAMAVLYGGGPGLRAAGDQFWTQDSPGIDGDAGEDDYFGSANMF